MFFEKIFIVNLTENFKINYACKSDLIDVFNLANDVITRQNSLNHNQIKLEKHIEWFNNKIYSNNCVFYIIRTTKNEFVGYIRFDRDLSYNSNKYAFVISLSLSELFRGKGLGSVLISYCSGLLFNSFANCKIIAFIKKDNITSYKCFLKSGFKLVCEEMVKGASCYKLEAFSIF